MKRLWLHPFVLLFGGVLLTFLGIKLFGVYTDARAKNRTEWEALSDARADSIKTLKAQGVKDSIVYVNTVVPQYIRVRDEARANPTPANVGKVIQACDILASACDSIQGNLRGQIRNLEAQNDLLRHKPGPPRLQSYGAALYDGIGMRPVIRTGAELKLLGPIYLKGEAEYAIPSNVREGKGEGLRILAGVRINFNR